MTVLYGLNGVGKSRILDAVRSVWTGESSGVSALVRVPRSVDIDHNPGDLEVNLARAWKPNAVTEFPGLSIDGDFEEILSDVLREQIQPLDAEVPDPYLGPLPSDRLRRIRDEMLDQRLVSVTPSGTTSRPSWTVCLAAMEEPAYPAISTELRRIRDGYRRYADDEPAPFAVEGRNPWGEASGTDPEQQLAESIAFEWVGDPSWTGPLVGFSVRADDRPADFHLTYLGIDRLGLDSDSVQSDLLKTLAGVGVEGKKPGKVSKVLRAAVEELERQANERYSAVLRDAPLLRLVLKPIHQWFSQDAVEWRFGVSGLPLGAMSTAQRKWADWAIAVTLQSFRNRDWAVQPPYLLLMDEPEGALHRSAEAHMARELSAYAAVEGRQVIVATHSPELIDLPDVRVFEVSRAPGSTEAQLSDLRRVDLEALEVLGLTPSDLLRRQRGFLLLEGLHDEVLLKTWIGPELEQLRVEILPLRGGSKLPGTVESRVLFDFSDAHVFVLLDNIAREEIADAWLDAQARYLADGHQLAGDELRDRLGRKPEERQFLGTWLSRALEKGRHERVTPYGLKERDIIEYLPVQALVPGESGWPGLRAEHARAVEAGDKRRDFKTWLTGAKKARITPETLQTAALDTPAPSEVANFLEVVRTTVAQSKSRG